MSRPLPHRAATLLRVVVCASLLLSASAPALLRAAPAGPKTPPVPAVLAAGTVSAEATSTSLPATGTLDWTVRVELPRPVPYLQARLRLYRPSGRLLYQKTFTGSNVPTGTATFRWQRELADFGLDPDTYPLEISLVAETDEGVVEQTIDKAIRIYDPAAGRTPVAVVAHIGGVPMTDPQGRFVVDPGVDTRTRDDVDALASAVLSDPGLRLTVGVPPMLLQEWRTIAGGYELLRSGRTTNVPATSTTSRAYDETLATLAAAMKTGRLELTSMPYADVNLSDLQKARQLGDTAPQYAQGFSAVFSALETTPSSGTVPAGLAAPPAALRQLANQKVAYVVVAAGNAKAGPAKASSGASRVTGHRTIALLADTAASEAVASAETSTAVVRVFERQLGYQPSRPLVVAAEIGAGHDATVSEVLAFATVMKRQPWARLVTGQLAASRTSRPIVQLLSRPTSETAPAGYWQDVALSRSWAKALSAAVPEDDPDAATATQDSLIAQGSCWAGPDGTWSMADRGRAFAAEATRIARATLERVSIKAEDITLSGSRGEVPISIVNDSGRSLKVVVQATGDGVGVQGGTREVTLRPSDNYFTLPVDLRTALRGDLTVRVVAGPRIIASTTVRVSASYLDRLAMIGAVVLVLFVLLLWIVRRVRAAERRERYTDGGEPPAQEPPTE